MKVLGIEKPLVLALEHKPAAVMPSSGDPPAREFVRRICG